MNKCKAVFVRVLFVMHAGLAYWRVATIYNSLYVLLVLPLLLLLQICEGVYTTIKLNGEENKW